MLASLAVYVLVSWLDGGAVVGLALCSYFDVLCAHTSLDDKGKGEVRGGVGCPHSCGRPGRRFGRFRVRSRFLDFWRPFAFVFASVGRRRRGGGYPRRLVVCPARFHSST